MHKTMAEYRRGGEESVRRSSTTPLSCPVLPDPDPKRSPHCGILFLFSPARTAAQRARSTCSSPGCISRGKRTSRRGRWGSVTRQPCWGAPATATTAQAAAGAPRAARAPAAGPRRPQPLRSPLRGRRSRRNHHHRLPPAVASRAAAVAPQPQRPARRVFERRSPRTNRGRPSSGL